MEHGLVTKVNLSINKRRNVCKGQSLNVADIRIASIPVLWPRFLSSAFFITDVMAEFHILTVLGKWTVRRTGAKSLCFLG